MMNLWHYYGCMIFLNYIFHFIRPKTRLKDIKVFQPFIHVHLFLFQCHQLRKTLDSPILVKRIPSSTASSSLFLLCFFCSVLKIVFTCFPLYLNVLAYTKQSDYKDPLGATWIPTNAERERKGNYGDSRRRRERQRRGGGLRPTHFDDRRYTGRTT